ncbi:MAG: ornithine cyclodeaminase family protein [Acidipropionibacterium sp.]|jgi:ornithine cyclodeaminase/alanine dehydrogenase-like protein (mu-crystallin family)|nr:ornithine cyclodeaminase family protein [Acidipropionibacterium sp.]
MTLLLTHSDLERLVDTSATIRTIDDSLRDIALGGALQPMPFTIPTGHDDAMYSVMAAYQVRSRLAVSKLLADIPDNRDRGLPAQRSLIVLSSRVDGAPLAVLDGRVPTRERTAAASAVATRALSRPDSHVLGLVGAGGLAEPHLRAISKVRPIDTVVVWSRTLHTAERFIASADASGMDFEIVDRPEEVARRADILCTLTPSRDPIVRGEWLRQGAHVNAVGAPPRSDHRELDSDAVARSSLFIDDPGAAFSESGDLLIPLKEGRVCADDVRATLGEVLAGVHPGRRHRGEITLFDSVGIGVEDLAIANLYVQAAQAAGVGTSVDFGA